MIKFIKHQVFYLFGVPRRIIYYDNGSQFVSQAFQQFCNKFRIQSVSSLVYYHAANSLAEAFNNIIRKLLKKFVSKSQRDWDDKLGECLMGLPHNSKNLDKRRVVFLVYECEAVLSLEIQISSLRVALTTRMVDEEKHQLRLQELETLDDKRLQAQ